MLLRSQVHRHWVYYVNKHAQGESVLSCMWSRSGQLPKTYLWQKLSMGKNKDRPEWYWITKYLKLQSEEKLTEGTGKFICVCVCLNMHFSPTVQSFTMILLCPVFSLIRVHSLIVLLSAMSCVSVLFECELIMEGRMSHFNRASKHKCDGKERNERTAQRQKRKGAKNISTASCSTEVIIHTRTYSQIINS